ncbi:phosphatidylinositol 3-kinase-related protein kinase [Tieghemostelium lacteum]|uniref:Phosphatidylinositol 3-kinase-related protein kinase n=1 Tax=Tieghemostelium lacteum TaxID=361077 RepID=A0A151ZEY5_TIELA|nr:phosphatidylinositol 3-kinase-related protein kinase [Tieghemostelium lacteum]|eukprot:KYQ92523.1 phosphatidylinositol 3-kinase-related protein kinase [Tieghemostelium lacteum]
MISIVQSPKSHNHTLSHFNDEQVNKIVRSPIFQRKNFESLQKQQSEVQKNNDFSELVGNSTKVDLLPLKKLDVSKDCYAKKASNLLSGGNLDIRQKELIRQVNLGLQKTSPKKCSQGVGGGVYFLYGNSSQSHPIAVFKPMDEEAAQDEYVGADSQPLKRGMKAGTLAGEGALKEVAIYQIDQLHQGRFKVPVTTLVEICHPLWGSETKKIGSLQEYIFSEDTAEEFGYSKFSTNDIHRIGLLDLIIFNLDRHSGNLLAVATDDSDSDHLDLVPIDHSLSLPSSDQLSEAWFDAWLSYPQSREPFSQKDLELIESLDADSIIQQLHSKLPKLKLTSLETLKITISLLKESVKSKLTLYQIGQIMSRSSSLGQPSPLEKIVLQTNQKLSNNKTPNQCIKKHNYLKLFNPMFWSLLQNEIQIYIQNNFK